MNNLLQSEAELVKDAERFRHKYFFIHDLLTIMERLDARISALELQERIRVKEAREAATWRE